MANTHFHTDCMSPDFVDSETGGDLGTISSVPDSQAVSEITELRIDGEPPLAPSCRETQVPFTQAGRVLNSNRGRDTSNSMVNPSARPAPIGEGRKLSKGALLLIVEWLEVPEHFSMLHGGSARLEVGQRHPPKKTVYQLMLVWIQSKGFPTFVKNGDNLGKRFTRYQQKYKEALSLKRDSGFGLSMEELHAGLTLDDKLERICPHFRRMHVLYGERANVSPPCTGSVGLPGHPEMFVDTGERDVDDEADDLQDPVFETPTDFMEGSAADTMEFSNCHNGVDDMPDIEPSFATEEVLPQAPPPGESNMENPARAMPPIPPVDRQSNRRIPNRRTAGANQATSRPNLAEVYLDKLNDKNSYRQQLMVSKDKWYGEDLRERREARETAAREARETRESLAREAKETRECEAREARDRDRVQRLHEDKRAKRDHDHQLKCINSQHKFTLLTELLKSCKGPDEMQSMLDIIPQVISVAAEPPHSNYSDPAEPGTQSTGEVDGIDLTD